MRKISILLLLTLFALSVNAQTQIYVLDFETAGTYTTSVPEFTDFGGDYFIRTDGSDIGTFVEFTDIQGSYYFAVMDTDGSPGTYTNTTLNIYDIDISGYSNLEIRIYLAEDQSSDGNEDWDEDTYVHITGSIDGAPSENLIWIESELAGSNSLPRIDTDFDGFGDGTEITPAFIQFSTNITGTGSLLDIAIEFNELTSGDEDIAIDHIEIYDTGGTTAGGPDCANATLITEGTHHAIHTEEGTGANYDQWYSFLATVSGTATVENCASDVDIYFLIQQIACGNDYDMADDDVCGTSGYSEDFTFDITAGITYFIGIGNWDQATTAEYDWTLTETEIVSHAIINAYAISSTEIDIEYDGSITSVDPADYSLTGSQAITFSTATIDGVDDHFVHLSGASENMTGDAVLDNINDAANITSFDLYAGITPVMFTNSANAPDTLLQGYNTSFTGIISANDGFNNVWIADSEGSMNGVMIYDYDFDGLVAVGDEVVIVANKKIYYDLSEIIDPILISTLSSGNTPYGPTVIQGNAIDTLEVADSPNAEQWEGQLVTVNNAVITEADVSTDYYFYATDDCGINEFKVGDNVDYHFGSVSMNVGSMYNITGVVDFSYGKYRINPRDAADIVEIDIATSIVEEPGTQTPGATLDATVVADSLSAAEIIRFVVTDTGDDGLPTKVSQVTFYGGSNNTADFDIDIAGGYISFADGDTINYAGEPNSTSNMIQLIMNSDEMIIADGTSEEFVGYIWLDAEAVHGNIIQFMIDADNHEFLADADCSTQFATTFTADIAGNDFTIDNTDAINTIAGNNIKVYPNPANNVLFVRNMSNISEISIVDILGKTVQNINVNEENTEINISNLTNGMYFIEFISTEEIKIFKNFIKK